MSFVVGSAPSVGAVLRELRLQARLTQTEVASVAGYDAAQISNWERGRQIPGIEAVIRVLRVLRHDLVVLPREQ